MVSPSKHRPLNWSHSFKGQLSSFTNTRVLNHPIYIYIWISPDVPSRKLCFLWLPPNFMWCIRYNSPSCFCFSFSFTCFKKGSTAIPIVYQVEPLLALIVGLNVFLPGCMAVPQRDGLADVSTFWARIPSRPVSAGWEHPKVWWL